MESTENYCHSVIRIKGSRPHVNISQDASFAYGEELLMVCSPPKLKVDNSARNFDCISLSNTCYIHVLLF